jgi:hypothetical protein
VVDEAQNLSLSALEELRMLSNLTANGGAALQTILLGQPQFRRMLSSPDLDQLRQRVLASYHLGPLSQDETRLYIEHRMKLAGWTGLPRWEDAAFEAIFRHTEGIPRRINRLCARLLMHGALDEAPEITRAMVETTAEELQQDLRGGEPELGGLPTVPSMVAAIAESQSALPPESLRGDDRRVLTNLVYRVEALEERVGRREQLFQRMASLFNINRQR